MAKHKQEGSQNKIIILTILVLFAIFVLPLLLSYSNFYPPFLPKKAIYLLDSVVADIPLLPKTPKQVLTKALIRNETLNSYALNTKLNLEKGDNELISLNLNQAVENAGSENSKSNTKIVGEMNFLVLGKIDIETVKEQNIFNFKIKNLPVGLGTINNQNWNKLDLTSFQRGLSVNVRNDQQIIDDVRNTFGQIQNNLTSSSVFSKVVGFKTVKKENQKNYEVKIKLDKDSLKNIPVLSDLNLSNSTLLITVNSKSYYLTKLDLVGDIESTSASAKLNLHLSAELSKIGQGQKIEVPKVANEIKNPIDLGLLFSQATDKTDSFLGATKESKDLGENFLTLERLLSVILLFPKSI